MADRKIYALICFHILTGKEKVSPSYLLEKINILNDGLNAFNWLDYKDMGKAIAYCESWRIEIPPEWTDRYKLEIDALERLQQAGYSF